VKSGQATSPCPPPASPEAKRGLWSLGDALEGVLFRPPTEEVRRSYQQADRRRAQNEIRVFHVRIDANLFPHRRAFWYRQDQPGGAREFVQAEVASERSQEVHSS
jgi:hypothetical protein